MSEKYTPKEHQEAIVSSEHKTERLHPHHERELTSAEKEHGAKNQVEQLSKEVEQKALSGKELAPGETEQFKNHPVMVNKQLKDLAFARALTRTRKKLSVPSRVFSKIVHTQSIDRSSEFIGKTIARPTSMLSGAMLAFIGTSALLWITRKYGYEYNYLVVILLFACGWAIGLTGELLWRSTRKSK